MSQVLITIAVNVISAALIAIITAVARRYLVPSL
jgi:hypothetical protein